MDEDFNEQRKEFCKVGPQIKAVAEQLIKMVDMANDPTISDQELDEFLNGFKAQISEINFRTTSFRK